MIMKIFLSLFSFLVTITEAQPNTCPICIDGYTYTNTKGCCLNRFCVNPIQLYVKQG